MGDKADRYKFRTSPLRNIALQAAFFHNGSFTRLEDALRYHLDTLHLAPTYDARAAGVDADLRVRKGPRTAAAKTGRGTSVKSFPPPALGPEEGESDGGLLDRRAGMATTVALFLLEDSSLDSREGAWFFAGKSSS